MDVHFMLNKIHIMFVLSNSFKFETLLNYQTRLKRNIQNLNCKFMTANAKICLTRLLPNVIQ